MTALRQRMLQDLQLAGLGARTCEAYSRAVRQLAEHFSQSPDQLCEAQVRDYLSYLKNEKGFAAGSLKIAYAGVKFFFSHTVPRDWQTLSGARTSSPTPRPSATAERRFATSRATSFVSRSRTRGFCPVRTVASVSAGRSPERAGGVSWNSTLWSSFGVSSSTSCPRVFRRCATTDFSAPTAASR